MITIKNRRKNGCYNAGYRAGRASGPLGHISCPERQQINPGFSGEAQTGIESGQKMNYRPNLTARSLITRKSFAIGVLAYSTRDRFYAAMMAELQQQLLSRGYAGIYAFWNDDSEVEKAYDTILTRGVDGIITTHDNPALFPREIPTVIYGMQQEDYDCVLLDYETAIRNSLGYLLRLGHRKIGCLGIQPHDPRYPVFIRAMAEAGLEVRPEWMAECSGFLADAYQAAMNLLSRPDKPTALIAKNDMAALAVLNAAARTGISVPAELSVIGFDNIEEGRYSFPAVTTNGGDIRQLVEKLLETLFHRMAHPDAPTQVSLMKVELSVRESCAPAGNRHNIKTVTESICKQ